MPKRVRDEKEVREGKAGSPRVRLCVCVCVSLCECGYDGIPERLIGGCGVMI